MKLFTVFSAVACLLTGAAARSSQHVGRSTPGYEDVHKRMEQQYGAKMEAMRQPVTRRAAPAHLNAKTKPFVVDGTALPEVDFDIGESYAGLLPITQNKDETQKLYFWYFPSMNKQADKEITIWLNGGPGCSSLEGLLQENGVFQWQYGTLQPVPNPWTWVNLTNVVWVEQPVGTGFTQGSATAKSEADVANQFLGFWKNFVETFSMQGYKIYITGESYAGMYVPHIASAMLDTKDEEYYNLTATMIYDPSIAINAITNDVPFPAFVNYWGPLFGLNDTFLAHVDAVDAQCGLTAYLEQHLVYPPKGHLPPPPHGPECGALFGEIVTAATAVNPCWDIYQVATTCPLLYDVLGFPGSFTYLPPGGEIYFNRADVKKAINAPVGTHWLECNGPVYNTSNGASTDSNHGDYSSTSVLPGVIERSKRTIIGHGNLDAVLLLNGTLLAIQNMTWNGQLGFQSPVTAEFYVPPHPHYQETTIAAHGVMGRTHTERGLTYVETNLCGHMEPQYAPSASFRHMEFLLGRVPSLTSTQPFEFSDDGLIGQHDAPE